jgi:hypothetical protein
MNWFFKDFWVFPLSLHKHTFPHIHTGPDHPKGVFDLVLFVCSENSRTYSRRMYVREERRWEKSSFTGELSHPSRMSWQLGENMAGNITQSKRHIDNGKFWNEH